MHLDVPVNNKKHYRSRQKKETLKISDSKLIIFSSKDGSRTIINSCDQTHTYMHITQVNIDLHKKIKIWKVLKPVLYVLCKSYSQ